jgi:hypothetical protein
MRGFRTELRRKSRRVRRRLRVADRLAPRVGTERMVLGRLGGSFATGFETSPQGGAA